MFKVLTPEQDPFSGIWSRTSKMPVTSLKNDRSNRTFLSKNYGCLLPKDTECVPVKFINSKLHANKFMLPSGALLSCFRQLDVNLFLHVKQNSTNKGIVLSFLFYYTCTKISKFPITATTLS